MFGTSVITKCPYCNKVQTDEIGITNYYKYKGLSVIVMHCCNKPYIAQYLSEESRDYYMKRYDIPRGLRGLAEDARKCTLRVMGENDSNAMDEDTLQNKVIEMMKDNYVVDGYTELIKTITQATYVNFSSEINLFSEPLTEENKEQLEWESTICH